jgi:succinoglycan biosynthesis transport protein ExoP
MSTSRSPQGASQESEIDLREYFRPMWRRKWMILAITVLAAVGAFAITSVRHQPTHASSYVSSTRVYLEVAVADSMVGSTVSAAASSPPAPQQVSDQSQLVTDSVNTSAVYQRLHMKLGSAGTVTASPLNSGSAYYDGTSVIVITTKSPTARLAALLANTFASVYLDSRAADYKAAATSQANATQIQLNSIPKGSSNASTREQLELEIVNLRAEARAPNPEASQVAPAAAGVAQLASTRSPKIYAALGALVGLLVAIALAYGLSLFDRRIVRVAALEASYGYEVLGVLPRVHKSVPSSNGHPAIPRELLEALRALRVNLRVSGGKERARTLLVTSAMPGEGKSTLARTLVSVCC